MNSNNSRIILLTGLLCLSVLCVFMFLDKKSDSLGVSFEDEFFFSSLKPLGDLIAESVILHDRWPASAWEPLNANSETLVSVEFPKTLHVQDDGFCYDPWGERIIVGTEPGEGFFLYSKGVDREFGTLDDIVYFFLLPATSKGRTGSLDLGIERSDAELNAP